MNRIGWKSAKRCKQLGLMKYLYWFQIGPDPKFLLSSQAAVLFFFKEINFISLSLQNKFVSISSIIYLFIHLFFFTWIWRCGILLNYL